MGLFGRDDRPVPEKPQDEVPMTPTRPLPKPQPTTSTARTVLSKASRLEGTLSSSGDITVEGELRGKVETTGHLLVADGGKVNADVHGRNVTIDGTVAGDITADERIELEPSAKVQGNITAPRILIKDGATFEGQVFMKSPASRGAPVAGSEGDDRSDKGKNSKLGNQNKKD